MSNELISIDISSSPELSRLVDEVEQSGVGRLLKRGDESVAIVQPFRQRGSRRRYRPEDDPLLGIIGMLDDGPPTDIATFKDEYLADAIERRDG